MSGKNGDYWPGFVDALTNVVIAMVFVIVVLAISLSFSAQLLAKRMAAKVAAQTAELGEAKARMDASAAQKEQAAAQDTDARKALGTPAAAGVQEDARAPVRTRIAVAGTEAALAASAAGAVVKPVAHYLQLDFAPTALTLDEAAAKSLTQALGPLRDALAATPGSKLAVIASGPDLHLSENQRAAYIRAMAVRNHLLAQGVDNARVTTRIDTKSRGGAPGVAIRLESSP